MYIYLSFTGCSLLKFLMAQERLSFLSTWNSWCHQQTLPSSKRSEPAISLSLSQVILLVILKDLLYVCGLQVLGLQQLHNFHIRY